MAYSKTRLDLRRFDIVAFLNAHGVPWTDKGATVSRKCIGVRCPFCGDDGMHCGIFRDFKNWVCWKCGRKGLLWSLTEALCGVGHDQLAEGVVKPPVPENPADRIRQILAAPSGVRFAKETKPAQLPKSNPIRPGVRIPPKVEAFLLARRFTYEDAERYGARYCYQLQSPFYDRLILPVNMYGELVSFQGRDVTGLSDIKYHSPDASAIKSSLYGYDRWESVGRRMLLVEGALDVWRIGDEALGCFGTSISRDQLDLIAGLRLREIDLLWDSDAYWAAVRLLPSLIPLAEMVRLVRLPEGEDPDSLGRIRVERLIAQTPPRA